MEGGPKVKTYQHQYLGKCIDDTEKHNIKVGTEYLLKDENGRGKHFHVYVIPINQYYGCYKAELFETTRELEPEEASALMEHPVNLLGLDAEGKVRRSYGTGGGTFGSTDTKQEVVNNERTTAVPAKKVSKPIKTPKPSKPVQRGLFG